MSKWISVKDELPEGDGHCVIYRPEANLKQGSKHSIVLKRMVKIMTDATHWQELTKPPTQ